MKAKSSDLWGYKNTIMWVLLVAMLVPFYPAITVDQSTGGITLPDSTAMGVVIILIAFYLFWKYREIFRVVYTAYFIWLFGLHGDLGVFKTIPDMFNAYNLMFWVGTILLVLLWYDDIIKMLKGKKRR